MEKSANIKELASLLDVSEYKLRKTLLELGLGVLQSEAERAWASDNWKKKGFYFAERAPEIKHFKAAWEALTT